MWSTDLTEAWNRLTMCTYRLHCKLWNSYFSKCYLYNVCTPSKISSNAYQQNERRFKLSELWTSPWTTKLINRICIKWRRMIMSEILYQTCQSIWLPLSFSLLIVCLIVSSSLRMAVTSCKYNQKLILISLKPVAAPWFMEQIWVITNGIVGNLSRSIYSKQCVKSIFLV